MTKTKADITLFRERTEEKSSREKGEGKERDKERAKGREIKVEQKR